MLKQLFLAGLTTFSLNIPQGEAQNTIYGTFNRNNIQVESTYNLYDNVAFANRYSNFSQYGYLPSKEGLTIGEVYTQNFFLQTCTIRPANTSDWIDSNTPTYNIRETLLIVLSATYDRNYELSNKFYSNIQNLDNMGWTEAEYKVKIELTNDTTPRADTILQRLRATKTTTSLIDNDISIINSLITYDYNYTNYNQAYSMIKNNADYYAGQEQDYVPMLSETNNGTNTKITVYYIQLRKKIPATTGTQENIAVLNNALTGYWDYNPYRMIYNYIPAGTNTTTEIIDLPGLLFTMLGMPFAWISTAFNLTLFPGTPYSLNIAVLFMGLVGLVLLIFILKKLLK